jgi:hypothetical protein
LLLQRFMYHTEGCLGKGYRQSVTDHQANPNRFRVKEKQYEESSQTKRGTPSFGENVYFLQVQGRVALSPFDKEEHQDGVQDHRT